MAKDRYKIGTKVITPEGEGVVRKNEKHSYRQGVKVDGIRSLRWFWPKEMKLKNTGPEFSITAPRVWR